MPVFVVCMRHTPQSSPTSNKVKKKFWTIAEKRKEGAGAQEVRILSAYTSAPNHLVWFILEAPSKQEVERYFTEIGFTFWNSMEIKQVKPVADVIKKEKAE